MNNRLMGAIGSMLISACAGETLEHEDQAVDVAAATITRVIPIRVIELRDCAPEMASCQTLVDKPLLDQTITSINEAYNPAGMKFWIKSLEHHWMPTFAQTTGNKDDLITWAGVRWQLQVLFDIPIDAYEDDDAKTRARWLTVAASAFGSGDELVLYVMQDGSTLADTWSGKSVGAFPEAGRHVIINSNSWASSSGPSPNHIVHEIGHYFGARHPNAGPHPERKDPQNNPLEWTDFWDLVYCTSPKRFFNSEAHLQSWINGGYCTGGLAMIYTGSNCKVNNKTGGDSEMTCTIDGTNYSTGNTAVKGFTFDLNTADNPPNTFGFGLNVMGYYSDYNAHLLTPGRFAASQVTLMSGHASASIPMRQSAKDAIGKLPAGFTDLPSRRNELGSGAGDFVWWSNGNLTFARDLKPISGTDYQPFSGDFDGDDNDDIYWYRPGSGSDYIWWGNGTRDFNSTNKNVSGTYRPVAGDFDGDNNDDIYWYNPGSGNDYIWWSNGNGGFTSQYKPVNGHYVPVAGDFDGNGAEDIAFYSPSAGIMHVWYFNVGTRTHTPHNWISVGSGFVPFAGDFDGNGGTDLFFYAAGSAQDRLWYSNKNKTYNVSTGHQVSGSYLPIVGDFDGNGKDDIFWDAVGATTDYLWIGLSVFGHSYINKSNTAQLYPAYTPISGDFDGDGRTDIFLYDN